MPGRQQNRLTFPCDGNSFTAVPSVEFFSQAHVTLTLRCKCVGSNANEQYALTRLYLNVKVSSTKVLIGDTILRLLIETGPPFYVAVRATQSSSRLHGKGITSFLRP